MAVNGVKGRDIQFRPEWALNSARLNSAAKIAHAKTLADYPELREYAPDELPEDILGALTQEIERRLQEGGHMSNPSSRPTSRKKRKRTLEAIVANIVISASVALNGKYMLARTDEELFVSAFRQPWICYHRGRGRYANSPVAAQFSHDLLIEYVDAMTKLGFLESEIATKQHRGGGLTSRLRATGNLLELIGVHYVNEKSLEYARSPVVMKDVKKNYAKLPDKDKRIVGIVERASVISAYAASHDVAIIDTLGNDVTFDVIWEVLEKHKLRRNKIININELISEMIDETSDSRTDIAAMAIMQRKHLYRVFNNLNIDHGGRFYGHFLQSLPKVWRRYATINGQPTTELDYASIHIHICYADAGIVPPSGDLYELKLRKANRKIAKTLTLVLINCESRNSAVEAMLKMDEQRAKNGKAWGLTRKMINRYIDAIIVKHDAIQRYLFSGYGVQAQNIDSRIAEKVMLDLMSQGVPCIPIHDSFVAPAANREQLRVAMDRACVEVIGRTVPIKQEY